MTKILFNAKILDLPLKKEWYEMIESGVKKEEYREIKPYWTKRLLGCEGDLMYCKLYLSKRTLGRCTNCNRLTYLKPKDYTHVRFRYGYTQRTMVFKLDGIRIGLGRLLWGAPQHDVFILSIGERVSEL